MVHELISKVWGIAGQGGGAGTFDAIPATRGYSSANRSLIYPLTTTKHCPKRRIEKIGVLRSDFANMEIMFFEGEQPNLEIIIEQLEELEQRLNAIEST